jgi:hypothetical protein
MISTDAPRKRGRKPLNQKKEIDKDIIQNHLIELESHTESLIAHIPIDIQSNSFDCHTFGDTNNSNKTENIFLLQQEIKLLKKQIIELKKETSDRSEKKIAHPCVKQMSLPMFKLNDCNETKDTKCWWCTYVLDKQLNPIYLPHKYVNKRFYVSGFFCSFNCVLSYSYSLKDSYVTQRANMIYLMYNQIIGSDNFIVPAPPKEVLIDFGGFMTINEFRENSLVYNKNIRILQPPMRSIHLIIEECDNTNMINNKHSYVPLNKADILNAKTKLKLKRTQPKKSNYISIEESLGLIKQV